MRELPYTVSLTVPVVLSEKIRRDEVTFKKRPTAGMMADLPADGRGINLGHFFPIIAQMTGEPVEIIRGMDPVDLGVCTEVVSDFLNYGRPTGEA